MNLSTYLYPQNYLLFNSLINCMSRHINSIFLYFFIISKLRYPLLYLKFFKLYSKNEKVIMQICKESRKNSIVLQISKKSERKDLKKNFKYNKEDILIYL